MMLSGSWSERWVYFCVMIFPSKIPPPHMQLVKYGCMLTVVLQCLSCDALGCAITANGVCLHWLVSLLHYTAYSVLLAKHNRMYDSINIWVYIYTFERKFTYCNTLIKKREVGLFMRVDLFHFRRLHWQTDRNDPLTPLCTCVHKAINLYKYTWR